MLSQSILIFNPDERYLSALAAVLQKQQYRVTMVNRPQDVLDRLRRERYEMVILESSPAGWNNGGFLAQVRQADAFLPILVITEHPCLETALQGIRARVFDYLDKTVPFKVLLECIQQIQEETSREKAQLGVLNQIQALLGDLGLTPQGRFRTEDHAVDRSAAAPGVRYGPYSLNEASRSAACGEKQVALSPAEFSYWGTLLRHAPGVVSYDQLVSEARGFDQDGCEVTSMARWHIHELRRIFDQEWGKNPIRTIRGIGYQVIV